jgi:arabinofuranosyltransferase
MSTVAFDERESSSGPSEFAPLRRRHDLAAWLIAMIPFALLTYRFNWLVDDAFISFRYAKHLAGGHGLRYNIGESPPVEGYSNLLWVLILTPFEKLGPYAPVASRVLSVACGVLLLWRIARFLGTAVKPARSLLILSLLFPCTFPPLAAWSTSGMETVPFALLVFLAYEFIVAARERRLLAGVLVCLFLVLIRADGMIYVAVMLTLAAAKAVVCRDASAAKPLLAYLAITVLAVLFLTAFRLAYFGWPLPNTVYAKAGLGAMTLERGGKYVLSFLLVFPHLMVLLSWALAASLRDCRRWELHREILAAAAATLMYPVVVGGDWMAMGRLLIPAVPFLAVAFGILLQRVGGRPVRAIACTVAAVVLSLLPAFDRHVVPLGLLRQMNFRYGFRSEEKDDSSTEYAAWREESLVMPDRLDLVRGLREHTRPGEGLIEGAIGVIGYYTDLFIYDPHGLVSPEVAHRAAPRRRMAAGHDKTVEWSYFLKDRPTYFCASLWYVPRGLTPVIRKGQRIRFPRDAFTLANPEAHDLYEAVGYPLQAEAGSRFDRMILLFTRRDLLPPIPLSDHPIPALDARSIQSFAPSGVIRGPIPDAHDAERRTSH